MYPPQVTSVDLSSDGTVLASGSGDHQMRICESRQSQSLSIAHVDFASVQGSTFYTDVDGVPFAILHRMYAFAKIKFGSRGTADFDG